MSAETQPGADSAERAFPRTRRVALTAPFGWLRLAWADLRANPGASLFYGCAFAAMGWLLHIYFAGKPHVSLALATGFTLVGPFMAIGLYHLSRERERGGSAQLALSLTAWRGNLGAIGFYAVILMLLFSAWIRVSVVLVALFFTTSMPSTATFFRYVTLDPQNLPFLAIYLAVGFAFALLVFAVSVISIPLMMDRGTDTITAMIASMLALARNLGAMLLWALLLALLLLGGLAAFYIGIAVTGPLAGHATWHAYRALVEPA